MVTVVHEVIYSDVGNWTVIFRIHGGGVFIQLSWKDKDNISHQKCLSWNEINPLIELLNECKPK